MTHFPIQETNRLILRPPLLSDAGDIQGYFNNWEIIQWMPTVVPWPYPDDGALIHLQEIIPKQDESYYYACILLKSIGSVIGTIRFEVKKEANILFAERGFCLSQEHWGNGLMSEASDATNHCAFTHTDISEMRAFNALGNVRSRAIKQKQGFILQGTPIAEPPYNGGEAVEEKWVLSREVWQKQQKNC